MNYESFFENENKSNKKEKTRTNWKSKLWLEITGGDRFKFYWRLMKKSRVNTKKTICEHSFCFERKLDSDSGKIQMIINSVVVFCDRKTDLIKKNL